MLLGKGLGNYPGQICYDPDRPSWLPYSIPSISEMACAAAHVTGQVESGTTYAQVYPDASQPPAVTPPDIAYNTTAQGGSNLTPDQAAAVIAKQAADEQAAWNAQNKTQMDSLAATLDKCPSWYQTKDATTGKCGFGGSTVWIAAAAAAGLFMFVMAKGKS